jgi:hypothetical protein
MAVNKKTPSLTAGRPSAGKELPTLADEVKKGMNSERKVRISVDIASDLHFNLRYFTMINKRTIASVVEELLAQLPEAPKAPREPLAMKMKATPHSDTATV